MMRKRNLFIGAGFVALIIALGIGSTVLERSVAAQGNGLEAPMFEVDPFWPKPLPNHWILGSTIGISIDSRDHVWIIHRQTTFAARTEIGAAQDPPLSECCIPAPNILEFDPEGNLVSYFGGPGDGYEWPTSNHGIWVDHKDNIWIGGNGGTDAHILKFTRAGEFLMQIGKASARVSGTRTNNAGDEVPVLTRDSNDMESFGRVAQVTVDPETNEAYVSDGYYNKRIVVLDADTGEFKRYWGAYGNKPDDSVNLGRYSPDAPPAQQFRGPVHCAKVANDGLVYVCDRRADRLQVFQRDGTFVTEAIIAPQTLNQGSTWDIAFSKDADQKYIYLADGQNMKVYILLRETMEVLTSFGDGGRQPGQFFAVHSIETDSQGNIYTTETYEGKRVQKFIYKGIGPVTESNQGVLWPTGG